MIEKTLRETGAFLEGHFLLSSGKHSDAYVQCAKLLMYPGKAELVIGKIVKKIKGLDFHIVLGPAMGGVLVSYEIGRQMGKPSIFAERVNGQMKLRRGFTIKKGDRVLIAEDVVTTGKSAYEAIKLVEELGGEVVGIACIVNRSQDDISYPLYSGIKLNINTYEGKDCPLCKKNLPIIQPGSRKIAN